MPGASTSPTELFRAGPDGVRLAVRLRPAGGADRIDGIEPAPSGGLRLKVRVRAAPEAGKANAALLKLLAKAWRLPAGDLSLAVGARSRDKVVLVRGRPDEIRARLTAWLERL